jgi:hypothetical protein
MTTIPAPSASQQPRTPSAIALSGPSLSLVEQLQKRACYGEGIGCAETYWQWCLAEEQRLSRSRLQAGKQC